MACSRCGSKGGTNHSPALVFSTDSDPSMEMVSVGAKTALVIDIPSAYERLELKAGRVVKIPKNIAEKLVEDGVPIWIL